jgi:hypothetical protein
MQPASNFLACNKMLQALYMLKQLLNDHLISYILCCFSAAAAVWEQHTTDAADSQDVAHAAQKATAGFFALARALGLPISPLSNQQLVPVYLEGDSEAQAALRRLKERAKATGTDLFELIVSGSVAEWEAFIISSFQEGCSADVQEATAQHQVGVLGTCMAGDSSSKQHESCCWVLCAGGSQGVTVV